MPQRIILLLLLMSLRSARGGLVVTLLRHAETEWNVLGKLQGASDSPLTEKGVQQAVLCGKRLKSRKFAAAYCSPLPRAKRTAELVLKKLDNPPQLVEDARLRERAFGDWEGMKWSDILAKYPEEVKLSRTSASYRISGGGESRKDNLREALDFLSSLPERHGANESVLIVTHSATAVSLVKHVLGLKPESRRSFALYNLAINEFQLDEESGSWTLTTLGDSAHLHAKAHASGDDVWQW